MPDRTHAETTRGEASEQVIDLAKFAQEVRADQTRRIVGALRERDLRVKDSAADFIAREFSGDPEGGENA